MNRADVRRILVVQAVEQVDAEHELVSPEELKRAASLAGAPLSSSPGKKTENQFLAKRAECLVPTIAAIDPKDSSWILGSPGGSRSLVATSIGFLVAVVLGFLSCELGPENRINILSFPLLGIILWSLVIYVRELFLLFRSRESVFGDTWLGGIARFFLPVERKSAETSKLEAARSLFLTRWTKLLLPVQGAKIKSMLHLIAFVLAFSAVAGMYFKGLANEYRAVWESTFFTDSTQLQPILKAVLGPAASIRGEIFPSPEELENLHWQGGENEVAGENAGRWIHWYAITIAGYVLLPRLILCLVWRFRSHRYASTLPFRDIDSHYFDHILATSSGQATRVRFVPYPASPDNSVKSRLVEELEKHLDRGVEDSWETAIEFGNEESIALAESDYDLLVPVFPFGATPEKETHLAVYLSLRDQAKQDLKYIYLDSTGFDRANVSFANAEERKTSRFEAWEKLFHGSPVELILPASISSSEDHDARV